MYTQNTLDFCRNRTQCSVLPPMNEKYCPHDPIYLEEHKSLNVIYIKDDNVPLFIQFLQGFERTFTLYILILHLILNLYLYISFFPKLRYYN